MRYSAALKALWKHENIISYSVSTSWGKFKKMEAKGIAGTNLLINIRI
jgi:hypothetical protein